jgi:DNA-binding PadR family transcriptional regulator
MAVPAMPAEHAILGLLVLEGGSGHGYDLARNFVDGQPLANVLRLESGMLYHHLKKMERTGWVESTKEQQSSRPARQVYHLTDAGRVELQRWLTEPVQHTREIRLEFLVKLYFARRMDDALVLTLIDGQLSALRTWLDALTEQRAHLADLDAPALDLQFSRTVLDLRIAQTRAAIDWLAADYLS